MSKQKKILGIDLGTTYSCVAHINEYGQPEVIPNAEGERTTPSVVWFDGNRAVVGQQAKEMTSVHPEAVCSFVKRSMGNDDFTFDVDGIAYTPEHVSGLILKKLVQDAAEYLGEPISDVVITCPAYFFVKEREATKRAGEIVGLNVLQIINEPTAAAFAYGIKPNEEIKDRFALVYDLGGGTFDTTIVRISQSGIDVLCTDGDHQLGGKDWDDCLVRHIVKCFNEGSEQDLDAGDDPEFYYDVLQRAEQCKKQLTDKTKTKTTISYQGNKVTIEITREQFDLMSEDLLDRTISLTRSLQATAKTKGCTKFDQLILVGGSSRMPQVAQRLRREFSVEPILFEPDEAIAKGAAILGTNVYLQSLVKTKLKTQLTIATQEELRNAAKQVADEYQLPINTVTNSMKRARNVTSKTFGITVLDGYDEDGRPLLSVSNLIYRNTPIPTECVEQYATIADKQQIVVVELVENSCDAPAKGEVEPFVDLDLTTSLWNGELPVKPDLPMYSPIDVTFKVDANGRLFIVAYDPASGGKIQKAIPELDAQAAERMIEITKHTTQLTVE